jgi:hypothetical protein
MFRKLESLQFQLPMIQGVQESNPQPMVLETIALPIELTPYKSTHTVLNGFHDAAYVADIVHNTSVIQAFPDHSGGFFP